MMDDFRKYATKHLGMNSMVLVPTATGIDHSDKTAETENEEIVLMK